MVLVVHVGVLCHFSVCLVPSSLLYFGLSHIGYCLGGPVPLLKVILAIQTRMGPGHSKFSVTLICFVSSSLYYLLISKHSFCVERNEKTDLVMKSFMLYKSCERFRRNKRDASELAITGRP